MSAHDNLAARLKSGAKLAACMGPSAKLGPAASSGAKQRKWRVLVSIGLLLPALAAIIGIVAWTISIEVANSDQQSLPNQQRQHQHHTNNQQHLSRHRLAQGEQQLRRDEALALAAMAAAQRSVLQAARLQQQQQRTSQPRPAGDRHDSSSDAPTADQDDDDTPEPERPEAPDAVSSSTSTSTPAPAEPRTQTRRRQAPQEQPNSNKRRRPARQQQQPISGVTAPGRQTKSESSLILTNRDQAEALGGGSESEPPAPSVASSLSPDSGPTSSMDDQASGEESNGGQASSDRDEPEPSMARAELEPKQQRPPNEPSRRQMSNLGAKRDDQDQDQDDNTKGPADEARPGDDSSNQSPAGSAEGELADQQDQSDTKQSHGSASSEQMDAGEQQEHQRPAQQKPIKASAPERRPNGQHKSRWMSPDKSAADSPRPQSTGSLGGGSARQEQLSVGNQLQIAKRAHNHQQQAPSPASPAGSNRALSMKQQQASKYMRNSGSGNNNRNANNLMMTSRYTLLLNEAQQEQASREDDRRGSAGSGPALETAPRQPDSLEDVTDDGKRDSANLDHSRPDTSMPSFSPSKAPVMLHEAEEPEGGASGAQMDSLAPAGDTKKSATDDDVSFEAIASAISSSLSSNGGRPATGAAELSDHSLELIQQRLIGATDDSQADEALDSSAPRSNDDSIGAGAGKRRRTTGEHVADVIDHIVETKRKQQRHLGSASDERLHPIQRGPQIVVVAPVGGQMKARSLVKSPDEAQTSKSKSSAGAGNKKQVAPGAAKKASAGSVAARSSNTSKLIGARLLGRADAASAAGSPADQAASGLVRYSEPVEVIEDDDSSALLQSGHEAAQSAKMEEPAREQQEVAAGGEQTEEADKEIENDATGDQLQQPQQSDDSNLSSMLEPLSFHVSSHAGEPRLRAPRHELDSNHGPERYPAQQQQPAPPSSTQASTSTSASASAPATIGQANSPSKLYTSEQQIRDQLLRLRSRPSDNQDTSGAAASSQGRSSTSERPQAKRLANPKKTQPSASGGQKMSSITQPTEDANGARTPLAAGVAGAQKALSKQPAKSLASSPKNQPARQQPQLQQQQVPQELMIGVSSPGQSVQVPVLFQAALSNQHHQQPHRAYAQVHHQHHHHHHYQEQQPGQLSENEQQHRKRQQQVQQNQIAESYQPMESQLVQQQVASPGQEQQQSKQEQLQLEQLQQQQHHQQQQQDQQQQADQAGALPVFADQEFNVPAHMAESVINEIQRSPSTVTGMLNGQATVFQSTGPQQQLYQAASQQHQQQLMQHPFAPYQQAALHFQQMPYGPGGPQPQEPGLNAMYSQQQQQLADYMRLVASQRGQSLEQQQQQQLANRLSETDPKPADKQQPARSGFGASSIINSVKALGPRSLVQPMAQRALRHLISSLSQQAAAQQAMADAESEPRSSSAPVPQQQQHTPTPGAAPATNKQVPAEQIQASGSNPVESVLPYQPNETPAGLAGRSMRSLPIGATVPSAAIQPQLLSASASGQHQEAGGAPSAPPSDQEVQESYGQMPAYQMADYPAPGYQAAPYGGSDPHDKRTKGVTFHFGGGPIGGGTQLITSPMGIFKHLMIPLMPNPRVNLNGKVVFGVVLEKTTAFGAPPKKKHKFWGR